MRQITDVVQLRLYIRDLNRHNEYDLNWRWAGTGLEPIVEVYEEADQHILASGPIQQIGYSIQRALSDWDLEDVD